MKYLPLIGFIPLIVGIVIACWHNEDTRTQWFIFLTLAVVFGGLVWGIIGVVNLIF